MLTSTVVPNRSSPLVRGRRGRAPPVPAAASSLVSSATASATSRPDSTSSRSTPLTRLASRGQPPGSSDQLRPIHAVRREPHSKICCVSAIREPVDTNDLRAVGGTMPRSRVVIRRTVDRATFEERLADRCRRHTSSSTSSTRRPASTRCRGGFPPRPHVVKTGQSSVEGQDQVPAPADQLLLGRLFAEFHTEHAVRELPHESRGRPNQREWSCRILAGPTSAVVNDPHVRRGTSSTCSASSAEPLDRSRSAPDAATTSSGTCRAMKGAGRSGPAGAGPSDAGQLPERLTDEIAEVVRVAEVRTVSRSSSSRCRNASCRAVCFGLPRARPSRMSPSSASRKTRTCRPSTARLLELELGVGMAGLVPHRTAIAEPDDPDIHITAAHPLATHLRRR